MLRSALLLTFLILNIHLVQCKKDPGVFSGYPLCGKTFADANGIGIFPFHVQLGNGRTVRASWAATLYQDATTTNIGTWYSTHGLNYSDDFMTDFDVCTVLLPGMTLVSQVHGQTDSGNCLTAMDQSCVNAIETQASNAANVLVEYQTGSPTTNLTKEILPTVCYDIGQNLHNNFPKECTRYWEQPLPQPFAFALTDHDGVLSNKGCCSSVEEYAGGCKITGDDADFNPYYPTGWTDYNTKASNHTLYDNLTYTIDTALTIYLPIANVERPQSFGSAASRLTCIHIDQFNNDSRVPPTLSISDVTNPKLSGGDIAGIVVGCVAAAVIVLAIAFYCWRRRSRSKRKDTPKATAELGDDEMAEAPHGSARTELSPQTTLRSELADAQDVGVELPNSMTERVELPTNEVHEKPELVGDTGGTELETRPANVRSEGDDKDKD